jgi:hypothetical protein
MPKSKRFSPVGDNIDREPPVPARGPNSKSILTGPEIGRILNQMGVAVKHFCRISGANKSRVNRQIRGIEPDIPLYYEPVLLLLHLHPELRHDLNPLPLPYEEWGVDVVEVDD